MTSKTTPRALTTHDCIELLMTVVKIRSTDESVTLESLEYPWQGAYTLEWVDRWNQTNGYWRRGNPARYHRWGEE